MDIYINYKDKVFTAELCFVQPRNRIKLPPRITPNGDLTRVRYLSGMQLPDNATSESLIISDDEVQEVIGQCVTEVSPIFKNSKGEACVPIVYEVVYDKEGNEIKRSKLEREANINKISAPVKIGKEFSLTDILSRYAITHTYQILHKTNLEFEVLYNIAKELHTSGKVLYMGAGSKGTDPLYIRDGILPVRGFLYGEVQDSSYRLLVLATNLEYPSQPA